MKKNYFFEMEMTVRDYECDLQGIVNNSVYQNYLEHCRHEYLTANGISFNTLHEAGVDAVVIHVDLTYKQSLRPHDTFLVRLRWRKKGRMRLVFEQAIYRKSDDLLCLYGEVTCAVLKEGKPAEATILDHLGVE